MAELVSKTYSEALFEVAVEDGKIDELKAEFDLVATSFETHPDFYEIFKTPKINIDEKKSVFEETFKGQISESLLNFFYIILDKKRSNDILEIKRAFDKRVDDHKGILKVQVESVVALSDTQLETLRQKIGKQTGKEVVIQTKIVPNLIGGLVIKMNDRVIDGSVKYKLEGMLEGLTQIIV